MSAHLAKRKKIYLKKCFYHLREYSNASKISLNLLGRSQRRVGRLFSAILKDIKQRKKPIKARRCQQYKFS